jgi:hypothetical protein
MAALIDGDHCQEMEFDEFGITAAATGKHVSSYGSGRSEGNSRYVPDVEALPCLYESGLQSPPPGIHTEFIPGTKSEYSNAHNMITNNGSLQWEPDVCTL